MTGVLTYVCRLGYHEGRDGGERAGNEKAQCVNETSAGRNQEECDRFRYVHVFYLHQVLEDQCCPLCRLYRRVVIVLVAIVAHQAHTHRAEHLPTPNTHVSGYCTECACAHTKTRT